MSNLILGDTFHRIRQNLHQWDNQQLDKSGKFSRLHPVINELSKKSFKFSLSEKSKYNIRYNIWVVAVAYLLTLF